MNAFGENLQALAPAAMHKLSTMW